MVQALWYISIRGIMCIRIFISPLLCPVLSRQRFVVDSCLFMSLSSLNNQRDMQEEKLSQSYWFETGYELVCGQPPRSQNEYTNRIFRQHFGCLPLVVSECWNRLGDNKPRIKADKINPCHLLWALRF